MNQAHPSQNPSGSGSGLRNKAKKILGNLIDLKDKIISVAIKERGGSNVNYLTDW